MTLADPGALDGVARHIADHANELRARASRLAAAAEAVRWQSTAATSFRGDVRRLASDFRRTAGDVDDAAEALRRHAAAVRRVEAAIREAEHAVAATVHGAESAAKSLAHLVGL